MAMALSSSLKVDGPDINRIAASNIVNAKLTVEEQTDQALRTAMGVTSGGGKSKSRKKKKGYVIRHKPIKF